MYYDNFEELCKRDGVKPGTVAKATGIATATFTSWKQGKYTPKPEKLQLIADYFKVSVDYLMNGKEYEDFSDENALLVAKIRKDKELSKALMKYFELSEEKRKHIVDTINVLSNM